MKKTSKSIEICFLQHSLIYSHTRSLLIQGSDQVIFDSHTVEKLDQNKLMYSNEIDLYHFRLLWFESDTIVSVRFYSEKTRFGGTMVALFSSDKPLVAGLLIFFCWNFFGWLSIGLCWGVFFCRVISSGYWRRSSTKTLSISTLTERCKPTIARVKSRVSLHTILLLLGERTNRARRLHSNWSRRRRCSTISQENSECSWEERGESKSA